MSIPSSTPKNLDDTGAKRNKDDDDDDARLVLMGYAPSLRRSLGSFMNFAFGFTEVAVLASIAITFGGGLASGGPAVLVWGFFVNFMMTMVVAYSLAEICGAYPSAGSVYHWAGQLVPLEDAPLASYVTGWANWLGNVAGDASFAQGFASFLSSALVASGYNGISDSGLVGTSIAILFLWSCINFFRVDQIGWLNNIAVVAQTGGIFVIIVVVLVMTPKLQSSEFVFTDVGYYNESGWTEPSDKSYVCVIGLTAALYSFVGYETSAHLAEETTSSTTTAPMGIIYTCLATGIAGLTLIISMLYATTNVELAVNGDYGTALANIFMYSTESKGSSPTLGPALIWLLVINTWFSGISSVTVTGRITFALARDGGFPYSNIISQVNPRTQSPINSILFVFFIDALLLLLPLVGESGNVAFMSIVNLSSLGFQLSYGLPILFKLLFPQPDFPLTPMTLGKWSLIANIIAAVWLFGTAFILFLPQHGPATVYNFNWLIVVTGGFFFFGMVNWIFNARFVFKGPVRFKHNQYIPTSSPVESKSHYSIQSGNDVEIIDKEEDQML